MSYTFLPERGGGGILGGILLGHTCVCAVELEPYCREVLLQRQRDNILPRFPIWDDVKTFDGRPWRGLVDIICGGFPCQDISSAGLGAGITGERSGLWFEFERIIREIRPPIVFVENSPMLTIRGIDAVLGSLAQMGYNARWGVLGGDDAGAPHMRKRIWIFAYTIGIGRDRGWSYAEQEWKRIQSARLVGKSRSWSQCQKQKARILGMGDGVAYGVDRIKSTGNGQIPRMAALAYTILGN